MDRLTFQMKNSFRNAFQTNWKSIILLFIKISITLLFSIFLFVCVLRHFNSEVIKRPHLLSLAKDVKLGKNTVPTGNRTPGHRVAFHYATSAPRKLHSLFYTFVIPKIKITEQFYAFRATFS